VAVSYWLLYIVSTAHYRHACPSYSGLSLIVGPQDPEGKSLWELTWRKVRTVSSGLTPQILASPLMPSTEPSPGMPAPSFSTESGPSLDVPHSSVPPPATLVEDGGPDVPVVLTSTDHPDSNIHYLQSSADDLPQRAEIHANEALQGEAAGSLPGVHLSEGPPTLAAATFDSPAVLREVNVLQLTPPVRSWSLEDSVLCMNLEEESFYFLLQGLCFLIHRFTAILY
jgi:hypothetical protein